MTRIDKVHPRRTPGRGASFSAKIPLALFSLFSLAACTDALVPKCAPRPRIPLTCAPDTARASFTPKGVPAGPAREPQAITADQVLRHLPEERCSAAGRLVLQPHPTDPAKKRVAVCSGRHEYEATVEIDTYVQQLNELETYLATLGRSLSDPVPPEGVVVWRTQVGAPSPAIPSGMGSAGAATARDVNAQGSWEHLIELGKKGDFLYGALRLTSSTDNSPTSYGVVTAVSTDMAVMDYTVEGVFKARAGAHLPSDLAPQGKRALAQIHDQKVERDTTNGGDNPNALLDTLTAQLFDEGITVRAAIGPVPVMLKVGLKGDVGGRAEGSTGTFATPNKLDATIGPFARLKAYIEGYAGWDAFALGAGGDFLFVDASPSLFSKGEVHAKQSEHCFHWNGGAGVTMKAFDGRLYLILMVLVPWEKKVKKYIWEIIGYEGIRHDIPVQSTSATLCRPPPCGVGKAWCEGTCVDLGNDENNCGGCAVHCAGGKKCVDGSCEDCVQRVDYGGSQPGKQLAFSCRGPIPDMDCMELSEPADPGWRDNYLCVTAASQPGKIVQSLGGVRWSNAGQIPSPSATHQYHCAAIREAAEPPEHTWDDNRLCWSVCTSSGSTCSSAMWGFQFSDSGPLEDRRCVRWLEPEKPAWKNNYLCW